MQISSSSAATSSMALTALRDLFQTRPTETAGQISPTDKPQKGAKGPPPGPPPPGMNGGGVSTDTMSSLLSTQENGSSFASNIIDEADANGDGSISLSELAASLGADEASLTQAFGSVDGNGDGQIDSDELETGLKSMHGRHGPPPPPSAGDVVSDLLSAADTDKGGSLSLGEIASALGEEDETSLTDAFASLDTNGDGALATNELTAAVEAVMATQMAAYTANATATSSSSLSLAA